jgi:hypothetical protein
MKARTLSVMVAVLCVLAIAGGVAAAGVTISAIPSNPWQKVGQPFFMTVRINGNGTPVGAFGATLTYDKAALRYESDAGVAGFTGVVNATQPGRIYFNGVNVQGKTGVSDVLTIKFTPLKPGYAMLDLTTTSMAAAKTFVSITPQTYDGAVWIR